jgi:hypothetical protein
VSFIEVIPQNSMVLTRKAPIGPHQDISQQAVYLGSGSDRVTPLDGKTDAQVLQVAKLEVMRARYQQHLTKYLSGETILVIPPQSYASGVTLIPTRRQLVEHGLTEDPEKLPGIPLQATIYAVVHGNTIQKLITEIHTNDSDYDTPSPQEENKNELVHVG